MSKYVKVLLFLFSSFIALAFLVYSLINLEQLQISIIHPRIIIEFIFFVSLFVIAVFYLIRK